MIKYRNQLTMGCLPLTNTFTRTFTTKTQGTLLKTCACVRVCVWSTIAKGPGYLLQNSLFFKRHTGRYREEEANLGGIGGEYEYDTL